MLDTLTPYLPFAGIVMGASLQYVFTRPIEYKRSLKEMKTRGYMHYLKGVCERAQLSLVTDKITTDTRLAEAFTKVADAKAKICLYGSTQLFMHLTNLRNWGLHGN